MSKPIYVGTIPNGRLQVICYSEKQVSTVHEIFTGKGNYPVDYEEWDEGKDRKFIITYSIGKIEEIGLC